MWYWCIILFREGACKRVTFDCGEVTSQGTRFWRRVIDARHWIRRRRLVYRLCKLFCYAFCLRLGVVTRKYSNDISDYMQYWRMYLCLYWINLTWQALRTKARDLGDKLQSQPSDWQEWIEIEEFRRYISLPMASSISPISPHPFTSSKLHLTPCVEYTSSPSAA